MSIVCLLLHRQRGIEEWKMDNGYLSRFLVAKIRIISIRDSENEKKVTGEGKKQKPRAEKRFDEHALTIN